jgi:UDP-3-O-[3-hydroxymyristoyl] glucosamine N-acyltransferase
VKLVEIAKIVKGIPYGDEAINISNVTSLDEAQKSDLTFLFHRDHKTEAGVVISTERVGGKSGIIVKDTRQAMYLLLKEIAKTRKSEGISPKSSIEGNAQVSRSCTIESFAVIKRNTIIGNNTFIGAQCFIDEDVAIGENCEIHPNVVIYAHTKIHDFVIIGANSVIGKEGFGYLKNDKYEKIRHIGGVIIDSFVELGSCVTVDRGTIGHTVIGAGTKIDNQVHIAHNVKIGENCVIMGQSGIAGSSRIGNNVVLCGQVGISDHLEIGDDVVVYAKSGVFKPLKKGKEYSGTPAREHSAVLRALARLYKNTKTGQ